MVRMKIFSKYYVFLLAITFCILSYAFYFVCDDAFISFRYAKNLANGLGLIYNEGETPVEGYSNFLWVIIGGIFYYFKISLEIFLPIISSLFGIVTIFLMKKILERVFNFSFKEIFFSLLSLVFFPTFIIWSTSGLATMPYAFLMIFLFYLLILDKAKNKKLIFFAGICLSLIRFEGVFFMLFIYAISLVRNEKRKEKIILCLITAFFYLIYFFGRYFYYQDLFPNTTYMKVGMTLNTLKRGIDYNLMFIYMEPLAIIALCGFLLMFYKKIKYRYEIFTLYLSLFFYSIIVGGDFMPFFRFLLPFSVLQIIPLTFVVQFMLKKKKLLFIFFVFMITSFFSLFNVSFFSRSFLSNFHFRLNSPNFISERDSYNFMIDNNYKRTLMYKALLPVASNRKVSMVMGGIGLVGFYTDFTMFDCYGLVNKELRNINVTELRSPGHDKRVQREYFLKYKPDITQVYIVRNNDNGKSKIKWYEESVALNRRYKDYNMINVLTTDDDFRLLAMVRKPIL